MSTQTTGAFDAAQIAAEATERGDDPLASVIGQFGGYLSACWENLAGAGTFQSDEARAALESTLEWLRPQVTA